MTSVNKGKRNLQRAADHELVMAAIHPAPKPVRERKHKAKVMPRRKQLAQQLKAMVIAIIFWRDAQECVQKATDGAKCGNGLAWGHYQSQGQSAWLRYDLGNVFVQCGNHNLLDKNGDKSYATWFVSTFGPDAAKAMQAEARAHSGGKQRTIQELEELLAHYDDLYQNRYTAPDDIHGRIMAGYYGNVIRLATKVTSNSDFFYRKI